MTPKIQALLVDIRRELSKAKTGFTIDPTTVNFILAAEDKINELEARLNEPLVPKELK